MAAPAVSQRFSFDDASGRLTEHAAAGVNTLFAWPAIHAFHWSVATGKSGAFRPEIALLPEQRIGDAYQFARVPSLDDHAQDAIKSFCATIPPRVRRVIAQFGERQWEVLVWVARVGLPAEDLLVSNPTLAFAVANLSEVLPIALSGRSAETQQRLLPSRKQREILERLVFAPTERVRRILRKVMPGSVSTMTLALLRDELQKPAVSERLAHIPAIGPHVLAMIDNGTIEYVTLAALEAFAHADEASADCQMASLVEKAAKAWGVGLGSTLRAPSSVLPARTHRCPAPVRRPARKTDFPPAPFSGTYAIVPLLYRAGLLDEARQQSNCVADYEPDVLRGKIAIYRVLGPERCTLSLKLRRGHWVVDQLKGWSNQEPGAEVVQVVREWLATRIREAKISR